MLHMRMLAPWQPTQTQYLQKLVSSTDRVGQCMNSYHHYSCKQPYLAVSSQQTLPTKATLMSSTCTVF